MRTYSSSPLAVLPPPGPPAPEPTPLDAALLADISCGLAAAEELWRPHAHHCEGARRPVRLVAADRWEAWVIGWTTGQRVELHDHGRSAAAVTVVEGELVDARLRPPHVVHVNLGTGSTTWIRPGAVHDIVAPGPEPATSIHVYSPPLRTMAFYDLTGDVLRTEPVVEEAPVSDLRRASRALHPSAPGA
ncbi:MAG: cysteine dioxygenase family protein [Acidimicrobiia bacterium]